VIGKKLSLWGDRERPYGYLMDSVFLVSATLYFVNRLVLKPITAFHPGPLHAFLHGYLNDVLCIPFCLPPLLFLRRKLGLRRHDGFPTRVEIIGTLVIWSVCFEWVAPRLIFPSTVSDPRDVVAYAGGAIVAGLIWGALRPARLSACSEGRASALASKCHEQVDAHNP
jgi:hypothetical protein